MALREGRKRSASAEAMNHRGEGNPNTIEILPHGRARCLQNNRKPLPRHWLWRGYTPDPLHPKNQAGALRKQARSWGKESRTQFQLHNLIAKPAGFAEHFGF